MTQWIRFRTVLPFSRNYTMDEFSQGKYGEKRNERLYQRNGRSGLSVKTTGFSARLPDVALVLYCIENTSIDASAWKSCKV